MVDHLYFKKGDIDNRLFNCGGEDRYFRATSVEFYGIYFEWGKLFLMSKKNFEWSYSF